MCETRKKKKSAEFCSFSHVKTFSWDTMMKLWKINNFLIFILNYYYYYFFFFSFTHGKKINQDFFSPNFRNSFHWEKRERFKRETKTKFWTYSRECSKKVWTFIFSRKNLPDTYFFRMLSQVKRKKTKILMIIMAKLLHPPVLKY